MKKDRKTYLEKGMLLCVMGDFFLSFYLPFFVDIQSIKDFIVRKYKGERSQKQQTKDIKTCVSDYDDAMYYIILCLDYI